MEASILHGLSAWWETYSQLWHAFPLACELYLGAMGLLVLLGALFIWRGRGDFAFWSCVSIILVNLVFFFGEDLNHHVYRTIVLAEQIRLGHLSLILINPTDGEALPTFVYYSFLPYLPGVALKLLGFSAHAAVKLALGGELLIMALGLKFLVDATVRARNRDLGYLTATLFLCANYVFCLWTARMALAEIWVYSLVPWVALFLVQGRSIRSLTALLFLQAAAHPIVFAQAVATAFLVAWALEREPFPAMVRRLVVAGLLAAIGAAAFWVPQFLWKGYILGTSHLPAAFPETFLPLSQALGPRYVRSLGWWLPLAVPLMIVTMGLRISWRAWLLSLGFAAGLALQTEPLQPIAVHIPLLSYSLFIWRLMLPVAFLGFGALLSGWGQQDSPRWPLALLAVLSLATMTSILLGAAQVNLPRFFAMDGDAAWYRAYIEHPSPWGRNEFLPNYADLPSACDVAATDRQQASFADLEAGTVVTNHYLAVAQAPHGIVDYTMNGWPPPQRACNDTLILGPLQPGSTVRASTAKMTALLWLRVATLVIVLGALAVSGSLGRRRASRGLL